MDWKGIVTTTFRPGQEGELRAWLGEHSRCNIYFHVNPVLRDLGSKARREDVAALAWLHVDIDPRVGEDLQAERERALKLLRHPPEDLPPPTCILFSGGGYWGFWKLAAPVPINGEEEKYEHAKLYNLQLEIAFGADNCHNVDRIARLLDTVNRPDEKKRAKGQANELAQVVEWDDDVRSLERRATEMRARAGLTRPGDLLFIGDHAKLVVGAELAREQWEEQYGNARLPVENEAEWREMFDGDPPPGTLDPTFDEGS